MAARAIIELIKALRRQEQAVGACIGYWGPTRRALTLFAPAGDNGDHQIRYDLRKLRLHGLIERIPHSHAYRFTQKGYKLALLLIQLRKRIYGSVAFGILRHQLNPQSLAKFYVSARQFNVDRSNRSTPRP